MLQPLEEGRKRVPEARAGRRMVLVQAFSDEEGRRIRKGAPRRLFRQTCQRDQSQACEQDLIKARLVRSFCGENLRKGRDVGDGRTRGTAELCPRVPKRALNACRAKVCSGFGTTTCTKTRT